MKQLYRNPHFVLLRDSSGTLAILHAILHNILVVSELLVENWNLLEGILSCEPMSAGIEWHNTVLRLRGYYFYAILLFWFTVALHLTQYCTYSLRHVHDSLIILVIYLWFYFIGTNIKISSIKDTACMWMMVLLKWWFFFFGVLYNLVALIMFRLLITLFVCVSVSTFQEHLQPVLEMCY